MNGKPNDADNQWFIRGRSHGLFHRSMAICNSDKLAYIRGYLSAANSNGGLHVINGRNGAIAIRLSRILGVAPDKESGTRDSGAGVDSPGPTGTTK